MRPNPLMGIIGLLAITAIALCPAVIAFLWKCQRRKYILLLNLSTAVVGLGGMFVEKTLLIVFIIGFLISMQWLCYERGKQLRERGEKKP